MSLVIPGMGRTVPYSGPTTNAPSGYKPQGGFPQYSPGRAQSIPSQSQGTPYGQQASGGGRMHSGYRGMPASTPSAPDGQRGSRMPGEVRRPDPPMIGRNAQSQLDGGLRGGYHSPAQQSQANVPYPSYGPGYQSQGQQSQGGYNQYDGNLANAPPDQRPPPFQASYGQIGGGYSDQPNFGQRDAFISQINNHLGQMQQQSWQRPMGAPQFDFGQMWGRAGDMVQQGWQNPLMGLFQR